jgi:hypothetical protein
VGIFFLQAEQHSQGAEVRPEIEEVPGRDLADHNAVFDLAFSKSPDHFGKLAYFEPDSLVDDLGQAGVGFTLEGDGDEAADTQLASLAGENERQGTVAGDEP